MWHRFWLPWSVVVAVVMAALLVEPVRGGMGCHPTCTCVCEGGATLPSNQFPVCEPVCRPPTCAVFGCSAGAPERCASTVPFCWTSCPADQCQIGCPECETLCSPLWSACSDSGCRIECEETECDWSCRPPPPSDNQCLFAACSVQCADAPCASPSSGAARTPTCNWTVLMTIMAIALFAMEGLE